MLDSMIPGKGFNEILDSALKFLSSALEINFLEGQNELELWCFGEGPIVEVTIGENSMETIGVTISGLIQKSDGFGFVIFVLELSEEDVRDFCLRLRCLAYGGSVVFLGGWLVDQVTGHVLGLQCGVSQHMAGGGLAYLGEAEHGYGFIEEFKQGDIS